MVVYTPLKPAGAANPTSYVEAHPTVSGAPSHPPFWSNDARCSIEYVPRRWILTIMCFLAVAINYSDRQNISVAIINMAKDFGWSDTNKGMVLSAFYFGYFLVNIPAGFLADRFGGKRVMSVGCLLWSLFTILTPLVSRSYALLLIMRVLLGVTEGLCWPAAHTLMSKWFPEAEISRAIAIFTSGSYFGSVLTLLTAPTIISAWRWPAAFYLFGAIGVAFVVAWEYLIADSPHSHSTIHPGEVSHIPLDDSTNHGGGHSTVVLVESISSSPSPSSSASSSMHSSGSATSSTASTSSPSSVPWRLLLTSKQPWAFYLNMFASGWTFFVLLSWMPDFFNEQYHISLSDLPSYTIWPYLSQGLCAAGSGVLSTYLIDGGMLTAFGSCTLMQMIGVVGPAVFLALLGFVSVSPSVASLFLSAALSLNAFTCAGVSVYHQLIAPKYAGLVFSIGNTFSILPGVIGIAAAGSIIDLYHSWTLVFLIGIISYLIGALVWVLCARAQFPELDAWEFSLQPSSSSS